MSSKLLSVTRSMLAIVAGYAVVAIGTTLTFEVLLGGIGYVTSSRVELAVAMVGAVLSGLAGGYVAARLACCLPVLHAALVSVPLAFDTAFVLTSGLSTDPLWFDLVGSGALMASAVLGGWLCRGRSSDHPVGLAPA